MRPIAPGVLQAVDENAFLAEWEDTVADLRIHGTTRKQVKKLFEEERPSLVEHQAEPPLRHRFQPNRPSP